VLPKTIMQFNLGKDGLRDMSGSPEMRFSNFLSQDFLMFVGFELDSNSCGLH
jgi:hypothetical protein